MNRFIFLIVFLAGLNLNAQNYTPVKGKIMTSWGEKITPENTWRDYPRPQLKRNEWQNLNGLWDYAIVARDAKQPSAFQGKILVPFAAESALSGVGKSVLPDDKLWYRRTFEIPQNWKGKEVILHFDAVDWETTVWVNGKNAGSHKGGSTNFSFNITPYLTRGNQELVVSVWDPTDTGSQARGKQVLDPKGIWYTPVTGIWQTVWLEPVSKTAITSVQPVSDIDLGRVTVTTGLSGAKGGEELAVRVLKNGKVITEMKSAWTSDMTLTIPSPRLWSPDSPELYQLELSLYRKGQLLDNVSSYFAMRKISANKDQQGYQRLQLNNKSVFQYGTLDQGWWPDGLLTPPSSEAMLYDMQVLKSMGFNMIRKHIKVEPALYYYYADSLGLLLWQDMVSGFETAKKSEQHVNWDAVNDWARPAESAKQFEYELKSMIDQLRFFPSIVTWVIFNEGWGQYESKRIVDWSLAYDKTRIINGVSGWTDRNTPMMRDAHQYPGPGMEPAELNTGRVIVLGEFGGLGLPVENHLWNPNMRNWGYRTYASIPELTKEYIKLMHNLYPMRYKGLSAAVYTQTTDVEGEVNGLITYDRKVIKMDPEMLKILHAPLYSSESKSVQDIIPDSQVKKQEIRFSKTQPGSSWLVNPVTNQFEVMQGPLAVSKGESRWSVKSFDLKEKCNGISLRILAYGPVKVFLNGHLVLDKRIVGKRHYEEFNISEFNGLLKQGNNLLAIEAIDFETDALFDYGLYRY